MGGGGGGGEGDGMIIGGGGALFDFGLGRRRGRFGREKLQLKYEHNHFTFEQHVQLGVLNPGISNKQGNFEEHVIVYNVLSHPSICDTSSVTCGQL